MASFKENINRICKERGTYLTNVVSKIGLSTSVVTRWNNGSLPKEAVMGLLAKELNCSVKDFFAEEPTEPVAEEQPSNHIEVFDNNLSSDEGDILRIYRSLDRKQQLQFLLDVFKYEET